MSETFFSIIQGGRLTLRSLPDKDLTRVFKDLPGFSLSTPREVLMQINPTYKDVPFIQEKLKVLKCLIELYRATIAAWESSEPNYPLLPKVKDQLSSNEKMLKEITGGRPCQ